jgi:hypothetical protein
VAWHSRTDISARGLNPARILSHKTPDDIFDVSLQKLVSEAILQIRRELMQLAPKSSLAMDAWICKQSSGPPEDCFRGLKAHFLLIPWFLEIHIRGNVDDEFQRHLTYSSINGYYFVRMLDNISDDHSPQDLPLLPMVAFFHSKFQSVYSRWFAPNNPFWECFDSLWIGMADATVRSALIQSVSEDDFVATSAEKIAAVKIPVAAVCFHYQRPDLLGPWMEFYSRFACAHEMLDDLCDWHEDLNERRATLLLSHASQRKKPEESIESYLVTEGWEWGYKRMQSWMAEARGLAHGLGSDRLERFVQYRLDLAGKFWQSIAASIEQLKSLVHVLERDSISNG